jgi:hypothetical protein
MDSENQFVRDAMERGARLFDRAEHLRGVLRLIDSWAEPEEVAAELDKDPVIALGVVRVAGSPLYGGAEVRGVQGAVEFLGFDEVRRTMLTLAVASWPLENECLHRRAVALAHLSDAVARRAGLEHTTMHFFAGLFADSGYALLGTLFLRRLVQRAHLSPVLRAERYLFGCTHAELSGAVAERFGLDHEVVEGVRWHEEPSLCVPASRPVADVVHAASGVLDGAGLPAAHGLPPGAADPACWERLGIARDCAAAHLEDAIGRADAVLRAVRSDVAA